ncbi:hypothetical protein GC176_10260 [bacterium]|nr:hypothetical protein [bacterium]
MRRLLGIHALLLLLASTAFTIVTAVFGSESLQWCYYRYSSRSGFGTEYVSDFTLPVVATYLAAFAAGVIGFAAAVHKGRRVAGFLGLILSMVGFVSFAIEGSHWLFGHHTSWLAFSPVLDLALVLAACVSPAGGSIPEPKVHSA